MTTFLQKNREFIAWGDRQCPVLETLVDTCYDYGIAYDLEQVLRKKRYHELKPIISFLLKQKGEIKMKTRLELMKEYAMKENLIIHQATDLTEPLDIEVNTIDEDVEELIIEHKKRAIRQGVKKDFIIKMEQRLCEFGGEGLVFDKDEYAELIYEEGQLWDGSVILVADMTIGKCHRNACWLYEEHRDNPDREEAHIVVGYALSEEHGHWFAHTWLVTKDETGESIVLETCVPCALYYGVILTEDEALEFVLSYDPY